MNFFWKIVKSDEKKIFNIVGVTSDDTDFTNTIAELQKRESIQCYTTQWNAEQSIQQIIQDCKSLGYKYNPEYHNELWIV